MRQALPLLAALSAALITACASMGEPEGPLRKEMVFAVTDQAELIKFNAGQPQRILARVPIKGLAVGERLLGVDFRVARGTLYGLSSLGKLYTIDTATGHLTKLGNGSTIALSGQRYGVDFNPAADRIRVVSDSGQNLRLHPDTGLVAATDPPLQYAAGEAGAGVPAKVVAAGYTYNKKDEKLTTNYALDLNKGTLVMQGTKEGATPAVSPNTGQLRTVGALGTGPVEDAALDISDVDNTPLAALRVGDRTRLYIVNLESGQARPLGTVGDGRTLWGMAIEP